MAKPVCFQQKSFYHQRGMQKGSQNMLHLIIPVTSGCMTAVEVGSHNSITI